jgi:hypothetical protein
VLSFPLQTLKRTSLTYAAREQPLSKFRCSRSREVGHGHLHQHPRGSFNVVCGDKLKRIGPLGWHGIYFTILCLLSSVLLYAVGRGGIVADGPDEKMGYLDAVFLDVTSVTGAGLINVGSRPFPSGYVFKG